MNNLPTLIDSTDGSRNSIVYGRTCSLWRVVASFISLTTSRIVKTLWAICWSGAFFKKAAESATKHSSMFSVAMMNLPKEITKNHRNKSKLQILLRSYDSRVTISAFNFSCGAFFRRRGVSFLLVYLHRGSSTRILHEFFFCNFSYYLNLTSCK